MAGGGSLIFGYLHKLGRNGHWQRRFFESDGSSLTYYKSGKRNKVLATLDLCKVRKKVMHFIPLYSFALSS